MRVVIGLYGLFAAFAGAALFIEGVTMATAALVAPDQLGLEEGEEGDAAAAE
jgi:hypothetical protein